MQLKIYKSDTSNCEFFFFVIKVYGQIEMS